MNGRRVEGHRFWEAVRGQPAELARLLAASEPIDLAADVLGAARRVFCAGAGTTWNAASVSADLLRRAGIDARAVTTGDFVQYPPAVTRDDAAVVLMYPGMTRSCREALDLLGQKRVPVVLVMGAESAPGPGTIPLGATMLRTPAGERGAKAMLSYAAAALLAGRVADAVRPGCAGDLAAVPDAVATALRLEGAVEALANDWQGARAVVAVGAGPHEASAHEAAMLISEVARRPVRAHSVEQFLHGARGQVREDEAFLVVAAEGPGLARTREAAAFARTLGCEVAWVSPVEAPDGARHVPVPDVGEALAPLVEVVPAQLLAGHLAAIAGAGADNFLHDDPASGATHAAVDS